MSFTWSSLDGSINSKLDWSQLPTVYTSQKHTSVLQDVTVKCETARISLGSSITTKGVFDLDNFQMYSEAISDEKLKTIMIGIKQMFYTMLWYLY